MLCQSKQTMHKNIHHFIVFFISITDICSIFCHPLFFYTDLFYKFCQIFCTFFPQIYKILYDQKIVLALFSFLKFLHQCKSFTHHSFIFVEYSHKQIRNRIIWNCCATKAKTIRHRFFYKFLVITG